MTDLLRRCAHILARLRRPAEASTVSGRADGPSAALGDRLFSDAVSGFGHP